MIKKLGLQLYTIRDYLGSEEQVRESFKKLVAMGYTQAQTAGFNIDIPTFAKIAKEEGIEIVGTHYNYDEMLSDIDKVMENHRILGTTNIGVGGMPGFARETLDGLMKFIDQANEIADKISKYGFKFTYHNHSFEFRKYNGKTMLQYLVEGLNPKTTSFVLDTYWVQHGGGDVVDWINKLNGRIDILHLKDMAMTTEGQKICEVLEGNINFDGVMAAAEKCGVKYYTVEQDTCPGNPFDSLKISADNIRKAYM